MAGYQKRRLFLKFRSDFVPSPSHWWQHYPFPLPSFIFSLIFSHCPLRPCTTDFGSFISASNVSTSTIIDQIRFHLWRRWTQFSVILYLYFIFFKTGLVWRMIIFVILYVLPYGVIINVIRLVYVLSRLCL